MVGPTQALSKGGHKHFIMTLFINYRNVTDTHKQTNLDCDWQDQRGSVGPSSSANNTLTLSTTYYSDNYISC